ncbi:MAG: sensor histidine kinase [Alphaproteobacteria bacterium]|nr:sensor histidine kinase [Alphaproteobacteria bacterium]MCW5738694.1 sensor histidine kinase [Alphaproteobacteria bacterium]
MICAVLPVILYGQFEAADRHMRDLVTRSVKDRSRLIAQAITPMLARMPAGDPNLADELLRHATDGMALKLLFQPAREDDGGGGFLFVAAAPAIHAAQLQSDLDELNHRGILPRLSDACVADLPGEIRYRQPDGTIELLTSIVPVRTERGCWVLVSTHSTAEFLRTSIGQPYWETRPVRVAAIICAVLLLLAVLTAFSIRRSLRQFREVAHEVRQGRIGEDAFAKRNIVPELGSVARDFDRLVEDVHRVARDIRQSAEDNAHSFKSPLATIRASLEPVRRAMPPTDQRAQRALEIVDASVDRLTALVMAAQHLDNNAADLIEAPRSTVNLTEIIGVSVLHFRELMASRDVRLIRRLEPRVMVRAAEGVLEIVLQNILENAISFTPPGGTIVVTLTQNDETIELQIDDEGPGIDPRKLDRIFERYFSLRPRPPGEGTMPDTGHGGLGLWIVRRNVEALGGRVTAANRLGGGLSVTVTLPRNGG